MGITLNPLLLAFSAVARTGSTAAAATELGLTQTAVTKRVQALENEISITLFLRSRKGMKLTEEGNALLRHCQSLLELESVFISQVTGKDRAEKTLTIAGPTSAISTRVAQLCTKIYRQHPSLNLHLRSEDHLDGIELIRRGEADFALVPPESVPNEMEGKSLQPDRFLLLACAAWKGRRLQDILENERIIDFNPKDPFTRNYLKKFGLLSHVKRSRLYVNENEALIHLFCEGIGYGVLTETVARPYLENGRLIALNRGQTLEEPLALAWYPRTQAPDYFTALIQALR